MWVFPPPDPKQAGTALDPGSENAGSSQELDPLRLPSSKCRRQEKRERSVWQRAAEHPQPRLPTSLRLSGSNMAAHLRPHHPGAREVHLCSSWRKRGLERGFFLNGKTKLIGGTSHSSKSLVYSAPLARNEGLLFPAEDHRPGDALGGKKNVSGGSVLAVFPRWLTSGTEPQEEEGALVILLSSRGGCVAFTGAVSRQRGGYTVRPPPNPAKGEHMQRQDG